MSKTNKSFTLNVYYKGGLNAKTDAKIRLIVGRAESGAGCCMFGDFERDMSFEFRKVEAACRAVKRVRKIKGTKSDIVKFYNDKQELYSGKKLHKLVKETLHSKKEDNAKEED